MRLLKRKTSVKTYTSSIDAPSGLPRTLGATRLTGIRRTIRTKDIFGITPGLLALINRGLSMIAKIFFGMAVQRDRQAKQIVAYFGQDLPIGPAHAGKKPELKLGAWHWY